MQLLPSKADYAIILLAQQNNKIYGPTKHHRKQNK